MSIREDRPNGPALEGDGRYIDPDLAVLAGEAAGQHAQASGEIRTQTPLSDEVPSQRLDRGDPTYYGQPVIKEPVWLWTVPAYFYVGGVAGGSALLGAVAGGLDGTRLNGLAKRCRWVAALGTLVSTGLLIADLGRPERFLNMLRVFRPTSPMSVGSWVLAGTASLSGTAAILSEAGGVVGRAGSVAAYGAGILGMPLAGYTAVLLGSTAVPFWQQARRTLPPLFIGSAMAGAASLLELMPLNRQEQRVVHTFGAMGKLAVLAAMGAAELRVSRVARVARPLRGEVGGALWGATRVLEVASLLVSLRPGRSRLRTIAAAALGTAAAIALRFAVFHLGKASARDPRATFHQQRAGFGGAEVTGTPAITGSDRGVTIRSRVQQTQDEVR